MELEPSFRSTASDAGQETTSEKQSSRRRWYRLSHRLSKARGFLLNFYSMAASVSIFVWGSILVYYLNYRGLESFSWRRYSFDGLGESLFFSAVLYAFALPFFVVTVVLPIARKNASMAAARVEAEINSAAIRCESTRAMILALRRRAKNLQLASWFSLFLTFIAISFGLYLFAIAGSIATSDYSAREGYADQLRRRFQDDVRRDLSGLRELNERRRDYLRPAVTNDDLNNLQRSITEKGDAINATIEKLTASPEKGNVSLYLLISTISTRIGSVLLLIFLVQILISVYRYSVRLKTYYDARADALLLSGKGDVAELPQLIAVLSPERIDFGKTPTSPTEHLFDAFKGAVAATKKTNG